MSAMVVGFILAQTGQAAEKAVRAGTGWAHLPHNWPGLSDLIALCQRMGPLSAIVVIAVGVLYLLWGYSFHKALVTLNAAIVGTAVGALIGRQMGGTLPGAILGGCCTAAGTWPMM